MQGEIPIPSGDLFDRRSVLPVAALTLLVVGTTAGAMWGGPAAPIAALVGGAAFALVWVRPDLAVGLLLSSFLVRYPLWMQGSGFLTLNNILGLWLLVVVIYRLSMEGNWWFLRNRELQLMFAIAAVFLISRYIHEPDALTLSAVGDIPRRGQDPARVFVGRCAFLFFFAYFIRTPRQARFLFVLLAGLAIATGVAAVWRVLAGGGWMGGYRASAPFFIGSAGNPNRMALFSVIGIVTLWYFLQHRRAWWSYVLLGPLMPLLMLSIFMAGSRSGVAGLCLAVLWLGLEGGLSVRKIIIGVLVILIAALLVIRATPEQSMERITKIPGTEAAEQDPLGRRSLRGRSYAAQLAVDLAEENPIIGVGIGNWSIIRYIRDPARDTTPPHSSYLLALVEGGLLTLGLFLVLFRRILKNFSDVEWALQHGSSLGIEMAWVVKSLRVGFIMILAFSLVGDLWLEVVFFLFIGLGVVIPRLVFEDSRHAAEVA